MTIFFFNPNKTKLVYQPKNDDLSQSKNRENCEKGSDFNKIKINPLEKKDAIILEITNYNSEINYLLAQAILFRKNTLCLYKKRSPPKKILNKFAKKEIPPCIFTMAY